MSKERRYLNKIDPETHKWRDLQPLYFKNEVLDRYKNHNNYEIVEKLPFGYLTFFVSDCNTTETSLEFVFRYKNAIMIYAREFVSVPLEERKYWEKFEVKPR